MTVYQPLVAQNFEWISCEDPDEALRPQHHPGRGRNIVEGNFVVYP